MLSFDKRDDPTHNLNVRWCQEACTTDCNHCQPDLSSPSLEAGLVVVVVVGWYPERPSTLP